MSVNADVLAGDALQMASLFLDNAFGLLDEVSDEKRCYVTEAACFLVQLAKATIDAIEVEA